MTDDLKNDPAAISHDPVKAQATQHGDPAAESLTFTESSVRANCMPSLHLGVIVGAALTALAVTIPALVLAPHVSAIPLYLIDGPVMLLVFLLDCGDVATLALAFAGAPALFGAYAYAIMRCASRQRRFSLAIGIAVFHLASAFFIALQP